MAAAFHKYSIAYESSQGRAYTAIAVIRTNPFFDISPGPSCSTPLVAPVVYQTEWVVITSDAMNWVEIGTDHGCNGNQWVFWGFGKNGVFTLRGTLNVGASNSDHHYSIFRSAGQTWTFRYDGVVVDTVSWAQTGVYVSAGLESYDAGALAGRHSYTSLKTEIN